ncbi:MAG: hypothetical protein GF364_04780 [Candidatus Lokiarchaeota archaeon]|nr:hypothetical protein [Candidatus Lokiarchaeota archaeon]
MEEFKIIKKGSLSSKLMASKEFFPITLIADRVGISEIIKYTKRPKITESEIIDVYSNDSQIGMFIEVIKLSDTISIGPCNLEISHQFRNILEFGLVKILEYYGIEDINKIIISTPDVLCFKKFLDDLGFIGEEGKMSIDLSGDNKAEFLSKLDDLNPTVVDRAEQIKNVMLWTLADVDEKTAKKASKNIIKKVKDRNRLGNEFWNFRSIIKLKNNLNTALLLKKKDVFHGYLCTDELLDENLINDEFIEHFIKTLIASLDVLVRGSYLKELFKAIEGDTILQLGYIQLMVDKLKELLGDDIKIDKQKYYDWISKNMKRWEIEAEKKKEEEEKIVQRSILKKEDFGSEIPKKLLPIVEAIVDHYNNERVFFGVENSF